MQRTALRQRGFTLVELVAVLVLLGILSAAAFSRLPSVDLYEDRVFQDSLQTSLRLAQRTALSHHASSVQWRLSHAAGSNWQYSILIDGNSALSESVASGTAVNYSVRVSGNATISGTLNSNGETLTLNFDRWGNFTNVNDGTNSGAITRSLSLTLGARSLCLSPVGFAYSGACRS